MLKVSHCFKEGNNIHSELFSLPSGAPEEGKKFKYVNLAGTIADNVPVASFLAIDLLYGFDYPQGPHRFNSLFRSNFKVFCIHCFQELWLFLNVKGHVLIITPLTLQYLLHDQAVSLPVLADVQGGKMVAEYPNNVNQPFNVVAVDIVKLFVQNVLNFNKH